MAATEPFSSSSVSESHRAPANGSALKACSRTSEFGSATPTSSNSGEASITRSLPPACPWPAPSIPMQILSGMGPLRRRRSAGLTAERFQDLARMHSVSTHLVVPFPLCGLEREKLANVVGATLRHRQLSLFHHPVERVLLNRERYPDHLVPTRRLDGGRGKA